MNRLFKRALLIVLGILILLVSPFLISPAVHDVKLAHFSQQLFHSQMPNNTVILEKHKILGKLNGNGNGMDYMAVILVRSELSAAELTGFFSEMSFKPVGHDGTVEIQVAKQESADLHTKYLEHGSITFSKLENTDDYSTYYNVLIYDGGYVSFFDIRGH